jgi:hypothetical protein
MLTAIVYPLMMTTTRTENVMSSVNQSEIISLLVVGSLVVGIAFQIFQPSRNRNGDSRGSVAARSDCTATRLKNKFTSFSSSSQSTTIKDIWQAGRSPGSVKKEKAYNDKPFGSKYYYAHNNPNSTGGYKDGLKMEDYIMNGPRLLSKNGISVPEEQDNNNSAADVVGESLDDSSHGGDGRCTTAEGTRTTNVPRDSVIRHVTKYLWDDPGDSNGVATIRIDVLPDKRHGKFVDWKDVDVESVSANLVGEGLIVKITTMINGEETMYRLKIDRLYGDATDVKCIIKSKRLLVKIYKKKSSFLSFSWRSNNLDTWPQPHRKI